MSQKHNQLRLGLNIRMRRHILRLTQGQLAEKVGCSHRYLSAVERGKSKITLEKLSMISRALECSMTDLLQNVE